MTPLTEKQKFNLKALGLGFYFYIYLVLLLGLFSLFIQGEDVVEYLKNIFREAFIAAYYYWYVYIPLQFILFLIARRILKKNSSKSVLKFVYVSFLVFTLLVALFIVFPPEGIRLIG